jgi:RNA polymerase sigma-70 factor (ECF subfamily)
LDDAELVNAFCKGDFSAYNKLVERWQERIQRVAYRYFNSYDDAMEITQQTFIKVYQKADSLNDPRKFRAWIYRIATNLCLDETNRAGRQKMSHLSEEADESSIKTTIGDVEQQLHQKETGAILHEAFQQIPDSQRIIIIMKEYEGLTFKEISDVLDIPESTAKSRMYYGLKKLRTIFDRWNINKETLYYE